VGSYRVEIFSYHPDDPIPAGPGAPPRRQLLPKKYNVLSELEITLEGDGTLEAFTRRYQQIYGKPWDERKKPAEQYAAITDHINYNLSKIPQAIAFAFPPPAIPGIGTAGGVIMTYYSPQVFFMSLTAFFLWRLIKENEGWWLYLVSLSLGLGILSHHMFIFFTGEVGLFLLVFWDADV